MTKRNLTLGTASGRLGSVVYFRRRGQQIARVLVSSVNDKRTIAQCMQRGRFANYVAAWRLISRYVGDSWRGASRYGSPENAFYHHNKSLMPCISKEMSRLGYGWPPLGILTYGSLPPFITAKYGQFTRNGSTGTFLSTYLPYGIASQAPSTVREFASALVGGGFGLEYGDIVHIMAWTVPIVVDGSLSEGAIEVAPAVFHSAVKLDAADIRPFTLIAPWWDMSLVNVTSGGLGLELSLKTEYAPDNPFSGTSYPCFCVWVERPSNPQYSRFSRSRIVIDEDARDVLFQLTRDSDYSREMAATYRYL